MTQPTRPYDALYDATFTVAGPRDHYRQQTLGGGFNIERAPVYNNFFSELPHYPPSTLRLKNADRVPGFIDRNYHPQPRDPGDLQQRSDALAVSGAQRPKYFRRPLLAAAEIHVKQSTLPPLPQRQDLNATAPAALSEPRSKTIGTQSDYRENEAQTAPWEPGFVLPERPSTKQQALSKRYHCDGPEVLHLRDMAFADGLPAGLQEVTRIDKMRAKRAFEATLPPIDDAARLPLRQKMIEEWEAREWEEREQEILSIQEQRLELLENALQVREEEIDAEHQNRVEDRKKATLAARAGKFADVQATRIKTMRQLIENRKYVEKHRKLHKPTIVERYANFGSGTYAPLQREGRFPESKPMGQEIETEGYEPVTLKGVLDLEAFLPSRLLNPKVSAPKRPNRLDFAGRKEAAVQRDLKTINDLLDVSKATAGRGHGDCWPAPLSDEASAPGGGVSSAGGGVGGTSLKRASSSLGTKPGQGSVTGTVAQPPLASLLPPAGSSTLAPVLSAGGSPPRRAARAVERPPTPELPQPPALLQPQHAALVLLQRLLRGRAAQNIMYEGRMRRQELIDELRLGERISADGTRLDGAPIRRPDARDAATLRVDALLGSVVSEVCAVLSESDPGKRGVLLAALGSSSAHTAAAAVAAAAAEISAAAAAAAAANAAAAALLAAPPPPRPQPQPQPAASASGQPEDTEPELDDAADIAEATTPPAAGRPASAQRAVLSTPPATAGPGSGAINLEALGITREQAEEAALRIQAAFKGHHARREVAAMRARGELLRRIMAEGNEHKVVVCQAAIRGYLGRKRAREMREAKAAEEAAAAATAAAGAEGDGNEQPDEASTSEAVMDDLSSYTDEQIQALTRIQAAGRGYIARKKVAAMRQQQQRHEEDEEEEEDYQGAQDQDQEGADEAGAGETESQAADAVPAAPEEREPEAEEAPAPVHSDYTVEQEVAVIRIQAAGRGFLARRRVAAMREETDGEPQRAPVIGRQTAPDEAYGAAAEATEGAEEGPAAEEEENLWPKMGGLSMGLPSRASPAAAPEEQTDAAEDGEGLGEDGEGGAQVEPSASAEPEASLAARSEGAGAPEDAVDPEASDAFQERQQEEEQEQEQERLAEPESEAQPEASLADGTAAAAEGSFAPQAEAEAEPEASLAAAGNEDSTPAEGEVSLAGGGYGGEASAADGAADDAGEGEAGEAAEAEEGEAQAAEGEPSLAVGEAEGEGYTGEPSAAAEPEAEAGEGEPEAEGGDAPQEGDGYGGDSGAGGEQGGEEAAQAEGDEAAAGDGGEEGGYGEGGAEAEEHAAGEESQGWAAGKGQEGGEGEEGGEGGEEGGEDGDGAGWAEGEEGEPEADEGQE